MLRLLTCAVLAERNFAGELCDLELFAHGPPDPGRGCQGRSWQTPSARRTASPPPPTPSDTSDHVERDVRPTNCTHTSRRHGRRDAQDLRGHPAHHAPHERSSPQREGTTCACYNNTALANIAFQWDRCLSSMLIRSGLGLGFGVVFSVLLFKRRAWPAFVGLGFGAGRAWEECDNVSLHTLWWAPRHADNV